MAMTRALLALCLLSPTALACDTSHLRLSGSVTVDTCHSPDSRDCVYSGKALHDYLEAIPDTDALFSVGLQSSPWRMYDGEMRILTVEDLVSAIRPKLGEKGWDAVELIGSWTGAAPSPGVPSLADRVSKALDGFPVRGEDGFLWLAPDGKRRTTYQAFTLFEGAGAYHIPKGGEVLAPLAAGWPAFVEDRIPQDDAELLMRAAAGWDVFFLCPDKALAGFEHAASKGSAIAAYNAALMRLERNADGDRPAALALLERGAALGDAKSKARLDAEQLRNQ
jgi:hypothetical protein